MNPGKAILGLVTSLATADIAAQAHVPFQYYLASISVFGFILAVLKAGKWFREEVETQIKAEFETHRETHKRLEDKMNTLIEAVRMINGRNGSPAITPLPFELPPTPIPKGE